MDFIFAVCDDAAGETCSIWSVQPMTAHWGMPDPATAIGNSVERRLVAEALATMLLAATVIGSGIMADRLTG